MEKFLILCICCVAMIILLPGLNAAGCSFPAPAANFENEKYNGKWYEIGKIQTKGGAFFERKCVCTQLDAVITNEPNWGDGVVDNECRENSVDGSWTNVSATLFDEDQEEPGRWLTKVGNYGGAANYTIIAFEEDDYAVEYDCKTSSLGVTNYCIHVLSRIPTMDPEVFNKLMQDANDKGLNPQNLPVQMTQQEGC